MLKAVITQIAKSQDAREGRGLRLNPEVMTHVSPSRDPVLLLCCYCVPWLAFLKGTGSRPAHPSLLQGRLALQGSINHEVQ